MSEIGCDHLLSSPNKIPFFWVTWRNGIIAKMDVDVVRLYGPSHFSSPIPDAFKTLNAFKKTLWHIKLYDSQLIYHQQSTHIPPIKGHHIDRVLTNILAKYWYSPDIRYGSTCWPTSRDRQVDQMLVDISTDISVAFSSIYQSICRPSVGQYKSVTVSNEGWTNYTRSQLTRNVISQIAQKCTFPVINHMETRLNCMQFYTRWIPWHRKFCLDGHLSVFSVLSTLPDNPGDSRFWTVSPRLQIRVWNLPDNCQSLPFLVDLTLWQWNFKYFALFEWFS